MLDFLPDWLVGDLKNMTWRDALYQILNMGMVISSALMIWKALICISGSESPIVVVLSGSMEPAFYRGDLLFLTHFRQEPIEIGEIVVYKLKGSECVKLIFLSRILSDNMHENLTTKLGRVWPSLTSHVGCFFKKVNKRKYA